MYIKTIIQQYRRDMTVYMECEHCAAGQLVKNAYDDKHYHHEVVPNLACPVCGKTAPDTYRPLETKYPEGMQI